MEIISRINWVDVLVVILMLRMSYVSFMDGLSHEIFPFLGSIAVVVLSLRYYARMGEAISHSLPAIPVASSSFLSFLIIVVITGFLVRLLKGLLDKIVNVQWHPMIEKFGGLVVGIMRAYIITSIVLTALVLMPLSYVQWSVRDKSLTGRYVLAAGPEVYSRVSRFLPAMKSGEAALKSPKTEKKEKSIPANKPSRK